MLFLSLPATPWYVHLITAHRLFVVVPVFAVCTLLRLNDHAPCRVNCTSLLLHYVAFEVNIKPPLQQCSAHHFCSLHSYSCLYLFVFCLCFSVSPSYERVVIFIIGGGGACHCTRQGYSASMHQLGSHDPRGSQRDASGRREIRFSNPQQWGCGPHVKINQRRQRLYV
jgi:hypothetical protein